ncbi:unnamed protein product, partial [Closterium sp. NIES-53]
RGASGGSGSCPYVIRTGDRAGQTCGKPHTQTCCFSRLDDAWRAEFGDEAERPRWAELLRSRVAIFDLDYDAILAAMYALSVSAEGDCYLCVLPDPGTEAAALGAGESALPGTVPAKALHTFTLDSGASCSFFRDSTTLTPLSAPVPVRLADPSGGPVLACSSTTLPCPAVSASGPVAPPCSCCLLSHQTLLWHHRLGHPSPPRLRGIHSRLLVSGLPTSLPPLPPSPAPPCLPCVEGRQRAAPHSSSFPPTSAPLQTLHMDMWSPARVSGEGRERYFLLVVDDYTRYTLVFPLRSKGEVSDVLIPWIRAVRLQIRERFRQDLPVLRLHSDRGGEFSSDLLRDFYHGKGILQLFTLTDSSQQNGIAERRIGLVMIHAAAPHFLWSFAGSRAFVRDSSADKLSARAIPYVFLGFSPDAPGWQFYHPTSRRVFPSQDVTFDESVPFYRLFPYRSAPPPPPPLFLAPGPPPVDPIPPQGPAPSGVFQVDPLLGTPEPLSLQQLREWFTQRTCLRSGATGAGDSATGDTRARGAGVTAGAGGTGGTAAAGPGGACTRGSGAAGLSSVWGTGVSDSTEPGAVGAGGAGAVEPGAGGAGAEGAVSGGTGAGGTVRPQPYFVPLLQQVLGVLSSPGLTPPLPRPPPDQTQPLLQPPSALPAPSPYTEQVGGLTERSVPASRPASPVRTGHRAPRPRPPPVPGTHAMALCPSSVPLHVPLLAPPESSLLAVPDPESDGARAANPTISCLLATVVTGPSFESTVASALVAELVFFVAAYHLEYATAFVAESESASPPSVGGECALGTDVLEDRQEDFECLVAAVPRFASMLLLPQGDPDAPDTDTVFHAVSTHRHLAAAVLRPRVLHHFSFQFSSPKPTPLSTGHSLSAPPLDESIEPSGPYPELVCFPHVLDDVYTTGPRVPSQPPGSLRRAWGSCLEDGVHLYSLVTQTLLGSSCEAEIDVGAMAAQELHWLTYLLTDLGEQPCSPPFLYVDNKAMIALCQEHRLEHITKHIALRYFLAQELQLRGQLRLAYVATRANTAYIFTKALLPGVHQRFSTVLGLVPTLPHLLTA